MIIPLIFTFISIFPAFIVSLQCWNCVGTDCDMYRASSKNWELVTCPEGSVCQKTDFLFYSNQKNQSIESNTIRSCSYETGCTWDRSKSCQKSPVEYAGRGCADRFCCGKDKCNGAGKVSTIFVVAMFSCSIIVALLGV
ncbi:UPAR/Ly6 domain-containing protein [Caenorhabditis elegans]|uniref:UPAR/Ly6 domain-containing protein n=1 Tax=Caenorhabditis elegans TaxID=6239 RepID=A7LPI5_CAEEL|nr:UPAR/Ly6 domain-containing protein [Caenorhabditis elegans]CAO82064.1 UPAR/Ly6 domain-containing protein [Caenorhabditis elegans]|eukprot:NP_001122716.1 Uncharacterized protein CELE_T03F6.9 [Caenorhabditis elegans]